MEIKISKRKLQRYIRADKVCRELRHTLGHPSEANWPKVMKLLLSWLKTGIKESYKRP